MRRLVFLLTAMALVLVVVGGVALAATKIGTDGPDTIMGTKGPDTLVGKGGSDWIDGPGADVISGGPGSDMLLDGPVRGDSAVDTLSGGDGGDDLLTINRPAARDIVGCGAGRDFADVDRKDVVAKDCERVTVH